MITSRSTNLTEVLACYPALDGVVDDDHAERGTAQGPGQAEVGLQQERRVAQAVLLRLVSLQQTHPR